MPGRTAGRRPSPALLAEQRFLPRAPACTWYLGHGAAASVDPCLRTALASARCQLATRALTEAVISARPVLASAKNMPVFGSVYSSLSIPAYALDGPLDQLVPERGGLSRRSRDVLVSDSGQDGSRASGSG
jgi:hypothetical protein